MSDVAESIKALSKDKFFIWIFRIIGVAIVFLIFIHIYKDFKGQHSYLFWGLHEVNNQKVVNVHDTEYVYKHDTILIRQEMPKQAKQIVKNEQKIDNGGSGIQNNAPNQGNQAGRDLYNINNEKSFAQSELRAFVEDLEKYRRVNKIESKNIDLRMSNISNGQKVYAQINEYLSQTGYTIVGSGTTNAPIGKYKGITFEYVQTVICPDCITITIGLFQ